MVLVDSSVWIEVFRRQSTFDVEAVVDLEEIVTCLPVIQEVLQGFDDQQAYATAREAMFSFPIVESPITASVFDSAIDLYRSARRSGLTIRSSVDCLIAACALRHSLRVLHADRDFTFLSQICPLQVQNILH